MNRFRTGQEWFDRLMPDGLPTHTSTLITGPGGSGKPLIGNVIAGAWLRQGGSVVFMSLQYPSHEFIVAGLRNVAGLDLAGYEGRVTFIELDVTLDEMESAAPDRLKANLVKPEIWDAAIQQASSSVPNDGPGVLVFSSALNLLLFSPTYGKAVLERMMNSMTNERENTYLFSVSTTAQKEAIAELESVADNLIESHSTRNPFKLFARVARLKDAPFVPDEIEVPFPSEMLEEVKEVADHSRLKVIPLIQKL